MLGVLEPALVHVTGKGLGRNNVAEAESLVADPVNQVWARVLEYWVERKI